MDLKNYKIESSRNRLHTLFILIPVLILTLAAVTQPQRIMQFAQTASQSATQNATHNLANPPPPPLYGCLQVGEGTNKSCASLQVKQEMHLTLHDRPLEGQTIWYGDIVSGTIKYTNIGDVPINIASVALMGETADGTYKVNFSSGKSGGVLNPGQSIDIPASSHRFGHPDPGGAWKLTAKLTDANGASVEDIENVKVNVNTTCTVLRIKDLTDTDKNNLRKHCANHPNTKLCKSQQYCLVVGNGKNCDKTIPDENKPSFQCDKYIIVSVIQQDLFEEICNDAPDSDMCKDYCFQTIGSPICIEKIQVPVQVPVTIRVANASHQSDKSVAGIQTGPILLAQAPGACAGAGATARYGASVCPGAGAPPPPPAPAIAPPKAAAVVPKAAPASGGLLGSIVRGITAVVAPALAPAVNAITQVPIFKTIMQTVMQTITQAFVAPFTRATCSQQNPTDCCAVGAIKLPNAMCGPGGSVPTNVSIKPSADIAAKHNQPAPFSITCNAIITAGCPPIAGTAHPTGGNDYVERGGVRIVSSCPGGYLQQGGSECINQKTGLALQSHDPSTGTNISVRVAAPGVNIQDLPLTGKGDPNCGATGDDPTVCKICNAGYSSANSGSGVCLKPGDPDPLSVPPPAKGLVAAPGPVQQAITNGSPIAGLNAGKVSPAPNQPALNVQGQVGANTLPNQGNPIVGPVTNTDPNPVKVLTTGASGHATTTTTTLTKQQKQQQQQTLQQEEQQQAQTEEQSKILNFSTAIKNLTPDIQQRVNTTTLNAAQKLAQTAECYSKAESQTCGSCVISTKGTNAGKCCKYTGNLVNGRCPTQPTTNANSCGNIKLPSGISSTFDPKSGTCLTPLGTTVAPARFSSILIIPPPTTTQPVSPLVQTQQAPAAPANPPQSVSPAEISKMEKAWQPLLPATNGQCEKGYTLTGTQCYFTPTHFDGGGLVTGLESGVRCQNPSNCTSGVCAAEADPNIYRCQ